MRPPRLPYSLNTSSMSPKPSEKRSRVSSSEEENHVLGVGDAILVDIQRRLEKLDLLDKIDERLIKMEDDMGTIKQKVLELEGGLNSVNSEVADLKESVEKNAEKEHLQLLEEEVEDLRNRSRRNNLVFYNTRKEQKVKTGLNLFKISLQVTWLRKLYVGKSK